MHCFPFAAASRGNATSVERADNSAMRRDPARLDFTGDRRNVLSETISIGLNAGNSTVAHVREPRIAENNAARLGRLQCVAGALCDQRPLVRVGPLGDTAEWLASSPLGRPELNTDDTKSPACDIEGIQGWARMGLLGSVPTANGDAQMRKALIALIATVSLALAAVLIAAPKVTSSAHHASASSGIDIFSLTGKAKDLPEQSYPAH